MRESLSPPLMVSMRLITKGRGPGEYLYPAYIFPGDDGLWVVDDSQRIILHYSIEGIFKNSFSFSEFPGQSLASCFHMQDKSSFIAFVPDMGQHNSDIMLSFFDSNHIVDSILYHNPVMNPGGIQIHLYDEAQFVDNNGKARFKYIFNDTIYVVDNNRLIPEFVIDLGSRKPDKNARELMSKDWSYSPFEKADRVDLLGVGDRYIYLKSNGRPYFLNKKRSTLECWYFTLPDDSRIAPSDLTGYVAQYIDNRNNLIGWVNPAEENDNPIVIVSKLK